MSTRLRSLVDHGRRYLTFNTDVAGFQVGHDLLGAAVHGVQDGVGYGQLAATTAGALAVEVGQDVGGTADTAVVFAHAPAEPHATVATGQHQNHVVSSATRRVELLPLTVLRRQRSRCHC